MELFYNYIEGVRDDTIPANEYARLAVERHLVDLEKSKDDQYPYYFDEDLASLALTILGLFRHTAGDYAGQLFRITPIQAFITCSIFGWVKKDGRTRKYKKAYLEVPRKWGKSEYLSALEIIFGLFDGEEGAQIITAATKIPQCNYVFRPMQKMLRKLIKDFPELESEVKIKDREVSVLETGNIFFCLSADAAKEDGANPHFAAVDELHAHINGLLLKVIETGTMARSQSLVFMITTAGFNRESICYDQRTTVINILKGIIDNDRYFGIICTLDPDDDWEDPSTWSKANPHIGITVPLENMIDAYQKAKTEGPSAEREFKTKNLNIWCDAPEVWVTTEQWTNCQDTSISLADFWGKKVALGLDLASTGDIAALCVAVHPQDGIDNPIYLFRFYCPATKVQHSRPKDGVNYSKWVKQGHIIMTPGNTIDYGYIKNDILRIASDHNITVVEYDIFNSDDLIPRLEKEGIFCDPHRQIPSIMNAPVKRLYRMIMNNPKNYETLDEELKQHLVSSDNQEEWDTQLYLIHDGNPVMTWMVGNIETLHDSNDNIKFSKNSVRGGGKRKRNNKIDGPVAMAMATTGIMFPPEDTDSAYNDKDLLVI